jgi:hypothetical protein
MRRPLRISGEPNMRAYALSLSAIAMCATAFAQGGANYQITINGQTSDVALGGEYTFITSSGETLTYTVITKGNRHLRRRDAVLST